MKTTTTMNEKNEKLKTKKKYSRNPLQIKYGFHVHKKKRIEPMGVIGKKDIEKVAVTIAGNGVDKVEKLEKEGGMEIFKSEWLASKSLGEIKKKIRNLKRMLDMKIKQNDKSNQGLIHSLELKLKSLNQWLELSEKLKAENILFEKYKYLKFVERKKISRRIKKCVSEDEKNDLLLKMNYIDFYPRDIKYIALFPSTKDGSEEEEEDADKEQKNQVAGNENEKDKEQKNQVAGSENKKDKEQKNQVAGNENKKECSKKETKADTDSKRMEILEKIKEFQSQGLLVDGFTWRWHSRNQNSLDPELHDDDKDISTDKTGLVDDSFIDIEKDEFFM